MTDIWAVVSRLSADGWCILKPIAISLFRRITPLKAYDRWAATCDQQPNNVVFALESALFSEMLMRIPIEGNIVADIGCGTGRHWPDILSAATASPIGVDTSKGMLERLQRRFPDARTICSSGDRLYPCRQ